MEYELHYCLGKRNGIQIIEDPFFEDVVNIISALLPAEDYFVILCDEDHAEGNMFVQTLITDNEGEKLEQLQYLIETRFEPALGEDDSEFSQYKCYATNKEDVLRLFGLYYSGKVIDVSDWTNITEQIKKAGDIKDNADDVDDEDGDDE